MDATDSANSSIPAGRRDRRKTGFSSFVYGRASRVVRAVCQVRRALLRSSKHPNKGWHRTTLRTACPSFNDADHGISSTPGFVVYTVLSSLHTCLPRLLTAVGTELMRLARIRRKDCPPVLQEPRKVQVVKTAHLCSERRNQPDPGV
jgi:hypothetical protein